MWLNIFILTAKYLFRSVSGKILYNIYTLAAAMLIAASSLHAQAPAKTDMTALSRLT